MKYNIFTFKNNKLLCWRLGPVNAIKQKHYSKDMPSLAGTGTHKPPISRGIWAFPYPHSDWIEREKLLKDIRKKYKPSTFYTDKFYSHIFPDGRVDCGTWYYWDNVRDWAKIAQKTLVCYQKWDDKVFKMNYSKDRMEIFVP